ncbi:MAG: alpha/beta hydrolase family protein [Eubacteriales bacterium]|nr:alpha/beta hydrolase family protein [Eubacteriales bacterium]
MALLHVDFFSDALGMCAEMDVILPEQTKGQIGMEGKAGDGKYPTLYLLHGMSDDHTIWQRRTSIERYVADKGIAVVMPSTHLGWYTDMHYGFAYWTYISKELPQICRTFFPNMSDRREDTFAAGLSMGGYGALKLGLRASDTFGAVAALSAGIDVAGICKNASDEDKNFWLGIFGPADEVQGSDNDLFALADKLAASGKQKPPIYMWCGTEDFLYEQNHAMRDHLREKGFDLTYEESPGDHSWPYWDAKIQTVLDWLPIGK